MSARRYRARRGEPMTSREAVLLLLRDGRDHEYREIARSIRRSVSAAFYAVGGLRLDGLVEERPCGECGRTMLALTVEGRVEAGRLAGRADALDLPPSRRLRSAEGEGPGR